MPTLADQLTATATGEATTLSAVLGDSPAVLVFYREKAQLSFDVVSDPRNQLAGALGIVDDGSDTVRAAQAALGLDLAQVNADGDVRLPMPAVVVVGADRKVRWSDVHPDYTTRTDVADIVEAAKAI